MRPERSSLGVLAGLLLGLGVVALAGSGFNAYLTHSVPVQPSPNQTTSTSQFVTTTSTGGTPMATSGNATAFGSIFRASSPSHVESIARQPVTLTGFVLLPVLAAFLFGFVLYRMSRTRGDREGHPEPA